MYIGFSSCNIEALIFEKCLPLSEDRIAYKFCEDYIYAYKLYTLYTDGI
jgi:hypothetical protein